MADYNENDLSRMRRDALRRMQEMQKRARIPAERPSAEPEEHKLPGNDLRSLLGSIAKPPCSSQGGGLNIGGVSLDEEKAMIAMLIYILYKQGADVKLLLALGYLLL